MEHRSESFESQRFGSMHSSDNNFSDDDYNESNAAGSIELSDDMNDHSSDGSAGSEALNEHVVDMDQEVGSDSGDHRHDRLHVKSNKVNAHKTTSSIKADKVSQSHRNGSGATPSEIIRRQKRIAQLKQVSDLQHKHKKGLKVSSLKSNSSLSQLTFAGNHVQGNPQEVEIYQSGEANMAEEEAKLRQLVDPELAEMVIEKSARMSYTD